MSLKEVCRACLCSGQAMCSLLDSLVPKCELPPRSVVDLWEIFTKMLIATNDSYPDKICTDCLFQIQQTYSFMLKCEKTEDVLKTMINSEIRFENLETVTILHEHESFINIKPENDVYPYPNITNISKIASKNIELYDIKTEYGKEDTHREQFQVIIHGDVDGQIDSRSQHALIVQHENYNFGTELLDHLDHVNGVANDVVPIQDIKQEPELEICSEMGVFDEIESADQSSTEIISCPGCRYACGMMESMEKHIIDIHMEGQTCKLCDQGFECSTFEHCSKHLPKSTNRKKKCHAKRDTVKRQLKCDICPKTFQYKAALMKHLRRHAEERPFRCEICTKTFQRKEILDVHLRQHTGERPFKCENCSATFINKSSLTIHSRYHTGERPFQCEICSKSFVLKSSLINHARYHTGERPFKCEICPKIFLVKHSLTNHLRYHTGERPFKCEICSKTFQRKEILTAHLRQHTGERPFKCENCSKSFINKSSLANHLKYHKGERLYRCENCPKTFILKSSLTNHLRQHTGERPFKCKSCPKTFILESNLTNHLLCHMTEQPFKCEICSKTFLCKTSLMEHFRTHTGEWLASKHSEIVCMPDDCDLLSGFQASCG